MDINTLISISVMCCKHKICRDNTQAYTPFYRP